MGSTKRIRKILLGVIMVLACLLQAAVCFADPVDESGFRLSVEPSEGSPYGFTVERAAGLDRDTSFMNTTFKFYYEMEYREGTVDDYGNLKGYETVKTVTGTASIPAGKASLFVDASAFYNEILSVVNKNPGQYLAEADYKKVLYPTGSEEELKALAGKKMVWLDFTVPTRNALVGSIEIYKDSKASATAPAAPAGPAKPAPPAPPSNGGQPAAGYTVAERPDIKVDIDGKTVSFTDLPVSVNGRTLLPLRALLVALGVPNDNEHIRWNPADRSVRIKSNSGIVISLQVGNKSARAGDTEALLDTAPIIYKDKTYLPARFIAESLGMQVDWNANTNTVIIKSVKQAADTGSATGNYTIDGLVAYFEKNGLKLDGKAENIDFPIAEFLSVEQKSFQIRGVKIEVYLYGLSKPDIAKMMDAGRKSGIFDNMKFKSDGRVAKIDGTANGPLLLRFADEGDSVDKDEILKAFESYKP